MKTIKKWHSGKILLLWIWGLVIIIFSVDFIRSDEQVEQVFLGNFFIFIIVAIPVILSIMTWIWLTGRENKQE